METSTEGAAAGCGSDVAPVTGPVAEESPAGAAEGAVAPVEAGTGAGAGTTTAADGGTRVAIAPASLSPSRASDFMQCPLLYRFRVIDRLPEKPSAAATKGTLVHAVLERLF
ncbi:MAG: DUF2800 domain-containing protein, partial [Streptomyces sp.]|nr:DUF2800 domain-containing protein [Streptomyces sp.]